MSTAQHTGNARSSFSRWFRLPAALGAAGLLFGGLSACAQDEPASVVPNSEATGAEQVSGENPAEATVAASKLAFTSSDVVVVGDAESASVIADKASELGVPGLLTSSESNAEDDASAESSDSATEGGSAAAGAGDEAEGGGNATTDEITRLGATTVFAPVGFEASEVADGADVVTFDPDTLEVQDGEAPDIAPLESSAPVTLFVMQDEDVTPAQEVAAASIEVASGTVEELPDSDPRATSDTVKLAKASEDGAVLALGEDFGSTDTFAARLDTARTAPEITGGGQTPFPGRRMVAAYGSPGIPELGVLGEQDLDDSVEQVQELAEQYEPYSDEQVIPAMEIIATVASAEPGPDNNYSTELDPEALRPWVDRAAEEGIYVVIDLQPGMSSFTEQAKIYEDLLKEPNVGLAIDSEWRLKDGQKHMEQIGAVDAKEINETMEWLAGLTAENDLPQKVFIMHQFSMSMITNRQDLDTSHDELAMVLHADGHGTPDLKMGTWNALQQDLPEGIRMAWKNFYDEDDPTFSPEQTMEVDPKPWFVSYQ